MSFPPERRDRLITLVTQRMHAAGERNIERFCSELSRDETGLEELAGEVSIGETYFFRDAEQFALIRNRILPGVAQRREQDAIRVWSAGCASGEEAYSLAITMKELGLAPRAHIIGTDIARTRLVRAALGRYNRWSFRGVPEATVARYFVRRGRRHEILPEIRELVEFRYLNLAEDNYPALSTGIWGFDLILCRNVLIYLQPDVVARVLRGLVASLADDGWLLLGASDPTHEVLRECEVITTDAGLAYRKSAGVSHQPVPRAVRWPERITSHAPLPNRVPVMDKPVQETRAVRDTRADAIRQVRALANDGELMQAERACAAALERFATDAELLYLHATLLSENGHHEAALRAARQALYLEPDFVVAHLALGSACARAGKAEQARRAFENAERLLIRMTPDAAVRGADGEPAGRLLSMTKVQLRLVGEGRA